MPDRDRKHGARPEFEVAYYTKELGKDLQRKMLTQQLAQLNDPAPPATQHGDDAAGAQLGGQPSEDRPG